MHLSLDDGVNDEYGVNAVWGQRSQSQRLIQDYRRLAATCSSMQLRSVAEMVIRLLNGLLHYLESQLIHCQVSSATSKVASIWLISHNPGGA